MSSEPAVPTFIPLSVPMIAGNEKAYINECLDTNWVSYLGPFVDRFERELARCSGAAFAVAMTSGTAALHIALILAGVEPESEVVMPAITFVAPANAVRYAGAWPLLIDLSEQDWQIDIGKLEDFLRNGCVWRDANLYNRVTGRLVSALMPVHLLGDMFDVDAVAELGARYGLPVIEDAAECVGATYRERGFAAPTPRIEASRRMVCTSFNGNKIVTTGGGGALLTDDAQFAARARHLSTTAKTRPLEFFHDEVGYNYRLTNIAAAMGVAQLELLPKFVATKRATAERYRQAFAADGRMIPNARSAHADSIYWLYTVLLAMPALPVVERLNLAGVQSRPIWTPIGILPAFEGNAMVHSDCFARKFHQGALSLPSSTAITEQEIDFVCSQLRNLL